MVIDQVARRCYLRPGLLARQVTARVGRSCIELKLDQGEVIEVCHADPLRNPVGIASQGCQTSSQVVRAASQVS